MLRKANANHTIKNICLRFIFNRRSIPIKRAFIVNVEKKIGIYTYYDPLLNNLNLNTVQIRGKNYIFIFLI
jgi:hypothetical protein